MRDQFEKLPEIAEILKDEDTHWCDKRSVYINQRAFQDSITGYLNGALMAFQEQQKIIQMQECGVRQILEVLNDENLFYENKCDMIKELLK